MRLFVRDRPVRRFKSLPWTDLPRWPTFLRKPWLWIIQSRFEVSLPDGNYCSAVKCLPSETDQRFFMVVHEIRPNGTLGSQIGKKWVAKSDQGQPVPRDGIRFMWKALPKQDSQKSFAEASFVKKSSWLSIRGHPWTVACIVGVLGPLMRCCYNYLNYLDGRRIISTSEEFARSKHSWPASDARLPLNWRQPSISRVS